MRYLLGCFLLFLCLMGLPVQVRAKVSGEEAASREALVEQAKELLDTSEMSKLDEWTQEETGRTPFSDLVKKLMSQGLSIRFQDIGRALYEILLSDYAQNRRILLQILTLALSFSAVLQVSLAMKKGYLSNLGFLGVYLILMLLLLKLFLVMTQIAESSLLRLVDFMELLQPVFCLALLCSTGSMSAGVYYELLLLLIACIDLVFIKILMPMVQIYQVLQLINNLMEERRFSKAAKLLADAVETGVKLLTVLATGLNLVQGLLAPGIDRVKRNSVLGAVRLIPGAGQFVNSMTELLAGSAMLIKNSIGAAAMLLLVVVCFLPVVKLFVFMLLYKGCAALLEPIADKRISDAVSGLGQSAKLYLKLVYYAMLLFFLAIAVICIVTSVLS